jgi:hypothetical protein
MSRLTAARSGVGLRVPALLLAVPLLGLARLLPEYGLGLWLRLAAATLVVLLPGRLVARALGLRGAAAGLSWSTAVVAGALALTFAVHSSIDLTLALVLSAGALALVWCGVSRRGAERGGAVRGRGLVALAGLALGGAIWFIEGPVTGDAIFHLGRVRKLLSFDSLSLHTVDEFRDGGLHPGYAFPLWHGVLALVARLADVDPAAVITHESSILVPVALVLALELGVAVFDSVWLGLAALLGQVAMLVLAPGDGGSFTVLALPGTTGRQLFVPAAGALFFLFVRRPSRALALTLAAAATDLSFIHPTYALFLALSLAAFVVARALLARGADFRVGLAALAALGAPMLLVFAWLRPIVDQTVSVSPGAGEVARGLRHYASDLVVHSPTSYSLTPEVVVRTGPVAVVALAFTPLFVLARARRWAAYVLGASVVVLSLELLPFVFPHFADAVSLSQARRAAGFVPLSMGFAGAAALLVRTSRMLALPIALSAGAALELAYPGDFGLRTPHHGPGILAWVALVGGALALVVAAVLGPGGRWTWAADRWRPLAALTAAAFVLPIAVHGFSHWSTAEPRDPYALTPGLIGFLSAGATGKVVFADLETSYRISGFAPQYVVAVPPAHVANTKPNRIRARRLAVLHFFRRPNIYIPRRWGARWLVLRSSEPVRAVERQGIRVVYRDDRFVVFNLWRRQLPLQP